MITQFLTKIYKYIYNSPVFAPISNMIKSIREQIEQQTQNIILQTQILNQQTQILNQQTQTLTQNTQEIVIIRQEISRLYQKFQETELFTSSQLSGNYIAKSGRDYNNYFQQITDNYQDLTNPFCYYQELINGLLEIDNSKILPVYELQSNSAENTRLIGLRHDIDADPITGIRCARYLARKGICGSFYLLHTSPYYGDFYGSLFIRNPMLNQWVKDFIVAGCEIGLHNDALGVYFNHNSDGIESIKQEITWLRSLGANIRGTVAHNSAPSYTAENYEIFQERLIWNREIYSPKGKIITLGTISEKELNLTYEGTFAIPKQNIDIEKANQFCQNKQNASILSKEWMYQYLIDNPCYNWGIDYQFWLTGKDQWVIAGIHNHQKMFEWNVNLEQTLSILGKLPENSRTVMVIHPAYIRG